MIATSILSAIAIAVSAVTSSPVPEKRSFYPPDYVVMSSCQTQGPVEVCALNKGLNDPRVKVTYSNSGYLWAKASPLNAWVSVNGNAHTYGPFTGFASQSNGNIDKAYYTINQYRDVHICYHATVNDNATYPTEGQFQRCPVTPLFPLLEGNATQGSIDWFYNPSPNNEAAVFANINGYNQQWNVQVAVFNEKGDWDSKFGQNYNFNFQ
ncbi:hypothetical protein HDU76_001514 [Blyttiomyces sp. JEL0837]|nr:hypothetical protein HDU76_001514 [Blyttiomyces sp. JEL0837]